MPRVLVTGTAGFIGFHLARLLLSEGWEVQGYDALTDYYDVALKRRRHGMLLQHPQFQACEARLEDRAAFDRVADAFAPDTIVHLAAQAGVRHSLEAPLDYLQANVIGTLSVLEAAKRHAVRHLLLASTSSVYGANAQMPFRETDQADGQLSLYAASKKANESMAHAWAHLYAIPTTCFRFFTVYGPWGRPDLALYKFVDAILEERPIDVYNHGDMARDFTHVGDLVRAIRLLMDAPPPRPEEREPPGQVPPGDSLSPVAPHRIVNIGNGQPVRLLDFVEAIEAALGRPATRNYLPMQPGDAPATWADAALLESLTGYRPATDIREGIAEFVAWYRDYSGK
jgi:UDP-glucuronate 4-epimerase